MTDQLQDIEQEMMFKNNKRKWRIRSYLFSAIWLIIGICLYLKAEIYGGPILMVFPAASTIHGQLLLIKYPFKSEHLKQ